ncbi:hypothetical protein DM02DRAFT_611290 [Periconia macrospinosa]|uniref:SGF29 C-terminal domain-containing protein n=1 Tax=Periconia macrospinosa TaxID=97972 RepID=A0A2V1E5Q5_9PLEO|nr:hypothetical protein DM02DRAFT_611290 [Periconia macrospinosa]
MARSDELQKKILELDAEQAARITRGDSPSTRIDAELDASLRENIKLSEEMLTLVKSERGNDICEQLSILSALRSADTDSSTSRATTTGKSRDRQNKRKLTDAIDDRDSIAADSPVAPSPKIPSKERLMQKSGGSRAGSVPAGRESSVKVEEDSEHVKDPKPRLHVHTEVLYRNPKASKPPTSEGEGILCRVTSVIGEGKQRRYEIIDADPEPPTPAVPYRASVNHLVPIPPAAQNMSLPDLGRGKNVLALYPSTTTFYKAEVVAAWRGKSDGGAGGSERGASEKADKGGAGDRDREKGSGGVVVKKEKNGSGNAAGQDLGEEWVRLRFEGEDEADREMSVERRYVLPDRA